MRSLGLAASLQDIGYAYRLDLTYRDGGTAGWDQKDVISIDDIAFEVPFGGALGKPVSYNVAIGSSLGYLQGARARLPWAVAALTVTVGSAQVQLHRGVVRGINTNPQMPHQFGLLVMDQLYEADPLVPVEAITDSWSTPHLEDLESGYPLYYGQHVRPIYFAAVASDVGTLLGPRNVSSANHVASAWYGTDFSNKAYGTSPYSNTAIVLMYGKWNQQSGSDNQFAATFSGTPFAAIDIGSQDTRLLRFNRASEKSILGTAASSLYFSLPGNGAVIFWVASLKAGVNAAAIEFGPNPGVPPIRSIAELHGFMSHSFGGVSSDNLSLSAYAQDSAGTTFNLFANQPNVNVNAPPYTTTFSMTLTPSGGVSFFDTRYAVLFGPGIANTANVAPYLNCVVGAIAGMSPEAFRRYGVFALQTNSSDVAISTNPWAILDDVMSKYTLTPYRQDLSSAAQVAIQSWQFNALFHERQKLSSILDEFARTCGVALWAGDSGMLMSRVYLEPKSASLVGPDWALTPKDVFDIAETYNPLGTSTFETQALSRVQLNYAYDYQRGTYLSTAVADRNSNLLCNSAYAAGVRGAKTLESKYIMDAATASLAVGVEVRRSAQPQDFIDVTLPMRFFGMEVGDTVDLTNFASVLPPQDGGTDLYQAIRVTYSLARGEVQARLGSLLANAGIT